MNEKEKRLLNRWRLVLGEFSEESLGPCGDSGEMLGNRFATYHEMDLLMDFLYSREYEEGRDIREGSMSESQLTVPNWLDKIQTLFPKQVAEKLEKHALEKYGLTELLTDARVLEKLEPNVALLKQVLALKGIMRGEVLEVARRIVKQVAEDLTKKMESKMRTSIMGQRNKNQSTPFRCAKNFDFKRTIQKNLKNYQTDTNQLLVERIYFHRNVQRFNPWHVIICVDESGSMLENVIHSAVMAGVFTKLPILSVKLVIFDTNVVDLSEYVDDPVETLMSVQLGGGTDIGKALAYCENLVTLPHKTMVVLVSDLCDGGGFRTMFSHTRSMIESGVKMVCLTSLDASCEGMYDRTAAKKMVSLGASVAALTPEKLADWIGNVIGGRA